MCNQSAPEAIKVVRRDAVGLLSFGDWYATRAINLNVPASLLLSIFKMDTATNRKVGRVTYCTGIVTVDSSPEFEAAAAGNHRLPQEGGQGRSKIQIFGGADSCSI